jgi:hypothetical protein
MEMAETFLVRRTIDGDVDSFVHGGARATRPNFSLRRAARLENSGPLVDAVLSRNDRA